MGKAFVLGFVTAIATMTAAVCFFVMSGALPAGQDSKLSRLEKWVAKRSLEATMRREAQGLENPLQPTDDNLTAGIALYRVHCQVCHGGDRRWGLVDRERLDAERAAARERRGRG